MFDGLLALFYSTAFWGSEIEYKHKECLKCIKFMVDYLSTFYDEFDPKAQFS